MLDSDLTHVRDDAEAYVKEAFGLRLDLEPVAPGRLPHYLLDRYHLWQGNLDGEPLLLVSARTPGWSGVSEFARHRDLLRRQLGVRLVLLLLRRARAATRRQLVDNQIGFLVPGAQLYIPEALLDLRERNPIRHADPDDRFGPVTQVVILAALHGEALDGMNLTALAKRFQVSAMSLSRTLDELETLGVAKPHTVGRQRQIQWALRDRDLWKAVETRLQSPIRKIRTVRGVLSDRDAPLTGESALARFTMLAEPRFPKRAIAATRWKQVQENFDLQVGFGFDDRDRIEVETWSYDPRVFVRDAVVDRLSLHLSMRHNPDERVAEAAQQLLEPFGW